MHLNPLLVASAILFFTTGANTTTASATPECLPRCWENSKYVSNCADNEPCLCEDADFQNASRTSQARRHTPYLPASKNPTDPSSCSQAVHTCLYSQCETARFASAIHVALSRCPENLQGDTTPALLRHSRRKRDAQAYEDGHPPPPPKYPPPDYPGSVYPRPTPRVRRQVPYGPGSYVRQQESYATSTAYAGPAESPVPTADPYQPPGPEAPHPPYATPDAYLGDGAL
ncbi:hypothetical protein W97_06867 [Coniosporium apollinis CBS 100218]|uniref:Extracellular membrane protein CFEM domain-containing protein n=1 Tax=Coniosporium apollinis (strain CBS 100218) TaxID=1168221 RepID=R7Z113_CONA1|nr:uncharacterized protein W97_06867 [Coniosporium apollinis CBS 100218]EON67724.1 hypothetical protein W97_06867 [Coniosporium apollinis CBS 100218]